MTNRKFTGLGPLWIVTRATPSSELVDIVAQATPQDLARQVKGGLEPEEILGWFDYEHDAYRAATRELQRAKRTPSSRYTVMSIPGNADDGSDTVWYVFDTLMRQAIGTALHDSEARTKAREMNLSAIDQEQKYAEAMDRWARRYDELNGAPENDEDR